MCSFFLSKSCKKQIINFNKGKLGGIETADLVTFTEEIRNRKLQFLCSEY